MESAVNAAFDADRVARKADGLLSGIFEARLPLKEWVAPIGCQEHEEAIEAKVLAVGEARALSPRPGPLRDPDVVLVEQLSIDGGGVLALRHMARHVEPVAVP